ncbi:MAG: glycoside hydrolase family 13 protein [Anaerolineae bacterium]|nr:glycoside hydrolase family 13 protein [Anaerolineae bacterium]
MPIRTPDWVKDAIFYQIFPDRFAYSRRIAKPANLEPWEVKPTRHGFKGGDLLGVAERLDYLAALGVTAIYFNPVFQSSANHRYHTHDYYRVDPILGGDEAFRELLDAAHARGMRIILDGVFNHASRGFLQFNHIMENGPASPYVDWFKVKGFPLNAYDREKAPNYEAWWNNHELPKLNTDNQEVKRYLFDVAEYWLKQGIDGWRLDVPLDIQTPGFWEEFRHRVKAINPEAYILAEIWDEARPWLTGNHFDAVMNYPFNRACLGFFGGAALDTHKQPGGFALRSLDAAGFAAEVDRMLGIYDWQVALIQYNLLSSHDEPRFLTLVKGAKERLRLATLFQMTFVGAPSIYYGDEIGLEGGEDPDCRRAFPWDESQWDHDLLSDFRRATMLRREYSALRRGRFIPLYAQGSVYAFARQDERESLIMAFNVGNEPEALVLPLNGLKPDSGGFCDVLRDETLPVQGDVLRFDLSPVSARVLKA